jgi:hypothetical protein
MWTTLQALAHNFLDTSCFMYVLTHSRAVVMSLTAPIAGNGNVSLMTFVKKKTLSKKGPVIGQ